MRYLVVLALVVGCDDGGGDGADPDLGTTPGDSTVDTGPMPDQGPPSDATPDPLVDAAPDAGTDAAVADAAPPEGLGYRPCAADDHVGGFFAQLSIGFTAVQGQVANGVQPIQIPRTTGSEGACALLQPPVLMCAEACAPGSTCGSDGVCAPLPENVNVGAVTIEGLAAPVAMTASEPVWFYLNRDDLPHPGFEAGAAISLSAEGFGSVGAFTLRGEGVAELEVPDGEVPIAREMPAIARWTPPAVPGAAKVHLELNIANHGGTPARIECEVEDTGEFSIPAALVTQLLDLGFSGFPTLALTRRSADSVQTAVGCVQLEIKSAVIVDVAIDGLTSCSDDFDCPDGQTCQLDLTCG